MKIHDLKKKIEYIKGATGEVTCVKIQLSKDEVATLQQTLTWNNEETSSSDWDDLPHSRGMMYF